MGGNRAVNDTSLMELETSAKRNQEKAIVGAFSAISNLRMNLRFKLYFLAWQSGHGAAARTQDITHSGFAYLM